MFRGLTAIVFDRALAPAGGGPAPGSTAAGNAVTGQFPVALAEAYATEFGRVYLGFSPQSQVQREQALEAFVPPGVLAADPNLGWNGVGQVNLQALQVAGIKVPDLEVDHQEGADLLVLSWGGTYGPVHAGVRRVRGNGHAVAHAHLRWLNPFPANLGALLKSYDRVLIPEMNLGQLLQLVRARYLVDAVGYNRVTGKPFKAGEIHDAIEALL